MAEPRNREEFKAYCLRRLGKGYHKVNVTNEQVEDRIDDALKFWRDYHYASTELAFFKHVVTTEDRTNKYITIPDTILEVVRIVDLGNTFFGVSSFTNPRYQLMMNQMWSLSTRELTTYAMAMSDIAMLNELLGNKVSFRFNRHSNKLYIDTNWDLLTEGNYLVLEAYYYLNPNTVTEQWGDRWLQQYATALIKRQWGQNMSKFRGVRLLDGYEFNVGEIMQEAKEEIDKLESEVINSYSLPPIGVIR